MNDQALEDLIRSKLRAAAPRDVPRTLAESAQNIPRTMPRSRRRPWSAHASDTIRGLRLAAAATAVIAVVALGAVIVLTRPPDQGTVAGPGIPSLPPVTQPPLPPGAAEPTKIIAGAWVSPTVAWLVDGSDRLRMTTDGGQTWSEPRPLPRPQDELRGGPEFIDASTGFAVWSVQGLTPVEVTVALTHDGGRTWQSTVTGALPTTAGDSNSLTVHFSNPSHGVVLAGDYTSGSQPSGHAGAGLQARACVGWSTANGGATWAPIAGVPCSDHDFWASPTVGIIMPNAEGGPSVSTTLDGGLTWTRGQLPSVSVDDWPVFAVITLAPDGAPRLAYSVNRTADAALTPRPLIVVESHDGGATWLARYQSDAAGDFAISYVTALGGDHWITTGSTAGGKGTSSVSILETADGGRSWVKVGSLGDVAGGMSSWLDRLHGMVRGKDNSGCGLPSGTPCHGDDTIFLTNDGGQTWHGVPF
jgi:hypothetical protein